jgi:hypothetical protein
LCRRTAIGRLVKWWFPARLFGIRHKNSYFERTTRDEIREWKREQEITRRLGFRDPPSPFPLPLPGLVTLVGAAPRPAPV